MFNQRQNTSKITKSKAEWQAQLTPVQYQITRCHGTERAFSSPDFGETVEGVFACICCGSPLFYAYDKYDSGTGWPSFTQPIHELAIEIHEDRSYGLVRDEVCCARCDAHLGHVFPDGPPPTGLRYCMNGHALSYIAP